MKSSRRTWRESPPAENATADLYRDHLATVSRHLEAGLEIAGLRAIAIFAGHYRERFLDDRLYPFKPNPHFQWWVPLGEHPDCWIYFEPNCRPRLIFVQPEDYWHQPPQDPRGFWCDSFDIRMVSEGHRARAELPAQLADVGVIGEADLLPDWGFATANPRSLLDYLHWQRAYKSDYELSCMRGASDLAVRAHRAAASAFRNGDSEYAIHLAYLNAARLIDDELPYPNIVALNEHGSVLHYQHRQRSAPTRSDSFLIDAGATCRGYASDITRTYASGRGEFQDLLTAMDEHQQELVGGARAGVSFVDLHRRAHLGAARILADFGIVRLDPEAIVDTGISGAFYPHGLGHFLGLQVHDVGGRQASPSGGAAPPPDDQPNLRLTRTLEARHVVTIEPGLYFIEPLLEELRAGPHRGQVDWDAVERLRPYGGVRIEDNVVVGKELPENLTRSSFAALA